MEDKAELMGFTVPPSLDDLQEIAEDIVSQLPREMAKYIGKLKVEFEDFPDDFIEEQLELTDPYDVLGVFQSAAPTAVNNSTRPEKRQNLIYLYRRSILDQWAETEETLSWLINRIILTEIGHHYNMTEAEVDAFEEVIEDSKEQLIVCE